MKFTGIEIGMGTTRGLNSTRWTNVIIYLTKGGKFVAEVDNLTQWDGEHNFCDAKSFQTPQEMFDWLRGDNTRLGSASQDAITKAAIVNAEIDIAFAETVE